MTLTWLGPSPWSADQLLAAGMQKKPALRELDKACRFLTDFLEDGPRTTREIWQAAESRGLSERTLRRAREKLEIQSTRQGQGHEHVACWKLKNQEAVDAVAFDEDSDDLSPWLQPLIEKYPPRTPIDDV